MISYSHCWEDTEVVLRALMVTPDDRVVSVTSGGCNVLGLASAQAKQVYAVDRNISQNHLLELKLTATKLLDISEVIAFLGYSFCENREVYYRKISSELSPEARNYWNQNLKCIRKGVVHCGKFERYLSAFRTFLLPLVHGSPKIESLLHPKDAQAQFEFYDTRWNTWRWRLLFRIFFSKLFMSGNGRSKEMFSQNKGQSVGERFFQRIEHAFKFGPLKDNFYNHYALLGDKCTQLPNFLNQKVFETLKNSDNISIHHSDLLHFLQEKPSDSIHKYNLSDIFEPLDIATTNRIFAEIVRTAAPRARMIFWNNLVSRDVPDSLKGNFRRECQLEEELKKIDRIFFYEKFYIYTIIK